VTLSTANPYKYFSKTCPGCDQEIWWSSYPADPQRLEPKQSECAKCDPEAWPNPWRDVA
jgi:hypothetical protein